MNNLQITEPTKQQGPPLESPGAILLTAVIMQTYYESFNNIYKNKHKTQYTNIYIGRTLNMINLLV